MRIQEAILSGKRFRRPGRGWHNPMPSALYETVLTRLDVLADDWEIEEKSVTITEQTLLRAFSAASHLLEPLPSSQIDNLMYKVKKELGF